MAIQWFMGTPRFYQGNYAPTPNEAINLDAFNLGALSFFWDRANAKFLWLTNIDENSNQTWVSYPTDVDNLLYPSVLPILGDKLGWYTSDVDPTGSEPISPTLLDGTYGILWWNRPNQTLFKLTEWDQDGLNQVWSQIV